MDSINKRVFSKCLFGFDEIQRRMASRYRNGDKQMKVLKNDDNC